MIITDYSKCEAYEVDFIGVPKEDAPKDADAICLRWRDSNGNFKTAVYDAGFKAHGIAMANHLNEYYFDDIGGVKKWCDKFIDYVFVSHPHNDHAGGIPEILNNFDVGCIYMNRPWLYTSELLRRSNPEGRATEKSLEFELRDDFSYTNKIEQLAKDYEIEIREAFAGTTIEGGLLRILSPDKDFYLDKVIESKKTKRIKTKTEAYALTESKRVEVFDSMETWGLETLGDDHAETDAENETSIILYGFKNKGGMLLVGDAGIEALWNAEIEAYINGIQISNDVKFTQIPHHGGRHNVTSSILNRLFGVPVETGLRPSKTAYVSVAEGSDHPRRVVVNAYLRRGFKVYKTKGCIRRYSMGNMPAREGYSASTDRLTFSSVVEKW